MNSPTTLDSFESALLTELRREVAEHPAPATRATTGAVRRPERRLRLAAIAATGVATSAVAVFGLGGSGGSPAYAVDQSADGDVIVTVHRLDDAAGLEQALADKGIDADVSYDPQGSPDGHTYRIPGPGGTGPTPGQEGGGAPDSDGGPITRLGGGPDAGATTAHGPAAGDEDGCGLSESVQPATLRQQGDDWVLRIPAGSPLLDGRHLGIGTTVDGLLSVWYAGAKPDTYCGVVSFGEPPD